MLIADHGLTVISPRCAVRAQLTQQQARSIAFALLALYPQADGYRFPGVVDRYRVLPAMFSLDEGNAPYAR